jgi:hypothetical protein
MTRLRLKVVVIGGSGTLGRARDHAALRALAVEGAMSGQQLRINAADAASSRQSSAITAAADAIR